MTQIFISYSRKDLSFVERLATDLDRAGFDIWYDVSNLEAGVNWGKEIQAALSKSQYMIVVLSPNSLESRWVEREYIYAENHGLKIIPVLYRPCELPLWTLDLQHIDMTSGNYEKKLEEILKVLGKVEQTRVLTTQEPTPEPTTSDKNLVLVKDESAKPQRQPSGKNKPIHKGWFIGSAVAGLGIVFILIKVLTGGGTTPPEPTITKEPATSAAFVTEISPLPTSATAAALTPTKTLVEMSGEITLWYYEEEDQEDLPYLIDRLEEAYPQLTIIVQVIPFFDFSTRYSAQVMAGSGPDLILYNSFSLQDPSVEELYADISELVKGRSNAYLVDAMNHVTNNGKVYGLPQSIQSVLFWYNKDLLPEPPATTDELLSLVQRGVPVSMSMNNCYNNYGFYGAFGGQIFDIDGQVIADQSLGVVDAIEYLNDLNVVAKSNGWHVDESNFISFFNSGNAAALINGNWSIKEYRTSLGDKLAVAALPGGPGGPATPFYLVKAFQFNPNSDNLDIAVEVAFYLTSQESLTYMMNEANIIPARSDVEITDPLLKDLKKAINTGYTISLWKGNQPQAFWGNFCGLDQVFDQGMSPADWVKAAAENARSQ